jgi:RNA polymerase sigma-70 factor, ECF subfamily
MAGRRVHSSNARGVQSLGTLTASDTQRDAATCDVELIRRISAGDESALSALMNKYSARVFSTAFRVLRQVSDAQEVTQDVFFAVWRHPERFESARGPLLTWLIIVSRSRAIDLLRRIREDHEFSSKIRDTRPTSGAFTSDGELLIAELLQRLPESQQRVLEALYVEGYAVRESADFLGLSPGTIKSRTRLALKKLRSAIATCKN